MKRMILGLAIVSMCLLSVRAQADDAPRFGPPAEIIAAWENGEGHTLPGPPAWVLEMRQEREAGQADRGGMPPWVAKRHAMAERLGIGGPPAEVVEAWQNGEGFDLPGPPEFVLDLMQIFRGQ